MSTENNSEFVDKYINVCKTLPEDEESAKVCPTCIPNPDFVSPNWWEQEEPFLDESNCMYSITLAVNNDGLSYDVAQMREADLTVKQLIDTYKQFGVLQLLRFYNKQISNEIIFAFPNNPDKFENLMRESNRDIARAIEVLQTVLPNGVSNVYDIPGPVAKDLEIQGGEVFNPTALELYAQSNDYYISDYQTALGGDPILVQVTIPAFIFDRVPKAQPVEKPDTPKTITLDGVKLKGQISRLKQALGIFGKYQAYWWQTEKGRLAFQRTLVQQDAEGLGGLGEAFQDYYCKNYTAKLDQFIEGLEYLIESQTRWKLRSISTPRSVEDIKIFFDQSNPSRPYHIDKIKVKGMGCQFENISLTSLERPEVHFGKEMAYKTPFSNQTLMGYIANIIAMDNDLTAKVTPPWVDFVVKYTFPDLSIQYGKGVPSANPGMPQSILGCVVDNLGGVNGLRDFFLETTLGFFDAISYKWNQNACKTLTGDYQSRDAQLAEQGEQSLSDQRSDMLATDASIEISNHINELQKEIIDIQADIKQGDEDAIAATELEINAVQQQDIPREQKKEIIESLEAVITQFEVSIKTKEDAIDFNRDLIKDLEKDKRAAQASRSDQREELQSSIDSSRSTDRLFDKAARQEIQSQKRTKQSVEEQLEEISNFNELSTYQIDPTEATLNKRSFNQALRGLKRDQRQQRRQNRHRERGAFRGEDPFVKAGREAVLNSFDFENSLVSLFLSQQDFEDYGLGGFDITNPVQKMKDGIGPGKGALKGEAAKGFRNFLARLGICGLNKLGQKAVQCLLGGMDLDTALRAIVRAALNAMAPNGMQTLLAGLDPRVQEEIRAKVQQDFKNMPAPWEEGYVAGGVISNEEQQTSLMTSLESSVESVNQKIRNTEDEINITIPTNLEAVYIYQDKGWGTIDLGATYSGHPIVETDVLDQMETGASLGPEQLSYLRGQINRDTYELTRELDELLVKTKLELEKLKEEKIQTTGLENTGQLAVWENMSSEEKDQMIEDQNAKRIVAINSPDQFEQGSIGKVLGSAQEAIFDAYIEAIMDVAEIQELFAALDKVPGAKLIARLIASFDCPNVHFVYPPIKSFLSTLSFDVCKERGRIAIPNLRNLPNVTSIKQLIFQLLRDAIEAAMEETIVKVLSAFVLKVLLTLENALCKALEATGRFAAEAVKGPNANFNAVVNELFCGDASDDDELDDITSSLLTSIGLTPEALDTLAKQVTPTSLKGSHKQLSQDISNIVSRRELKLLITANDGQQDPQTLKRISSTITLRHPEYAFAFDDPSKVAQIFGSLGNFMTPSQRQQIKDQLSTFPVDIPVDPSICLTKDQLDEWNQVRQDTLTNAGMSPEEASEYLDKVNDRANNDLIEIASVMAAGPTSAMQDAIDEALKADPDCDDGNAITKFLPEEAKAKRIEDANGVYRSLQISYINDMIGKRDSFLDNILADTFNAPLKVHERKTDNLIFQIDYANSETDWENKKTRFEETRIGEFYFTALSDGEAIGVFPETIGINARNSFLDNDFMLTTNFEFSRKRRNLTRSIEVGWLGLGTRQVSMFKPYVKKPDLKLTFNNDNDLKVNFNIETAYTVQSDQKVFIEKNFGYKVGIIYEGSNNTLEQQTDASVDADRKDKDKIVKIPQYRVINSILPDVTSSLLIQNYDVTNKELQTHKHTYQSMLLTNYLNESLASASHPNLQFGAVASFYNQFESKIFKDISDSLVETQDGEIPQGFQFGYEADPITTSDLLYVNPEADPDDEDTWEYTYENDDMVLGKSATENPRVHFLDPNAYGGSYTNPAFYVEPGSYQGWLGLAQVIVPEIDGCKPKRTDLVDFNAMSKEVSKIESSIEPDSRLGSDPDCVKHIPYDHIADPNTLAYLDVTVAATIRIYCSEALLKATSIFSFLEYNENNYDAGFAQMIAEEMEQGLSQETTFFNVGRYQAFNYWLVFLEQAVQSAVRKIKSGEISSTPEIDQAREVINTIQQDYRYPNKDDLEVIRRVKEIDFEDPEIQKATVLNAFIGGIAALTFPAVIGVGGAVLGTIGVGLGLMSLRQLRFATKMDALNKGRKASMVLLKALIQLELEKLSVRLAENTALRPYVSNLPKYILSNKKLTGGSNIKAGLYDIEKPIVDGELDLQYGDIIQSFSDPSVVQLSDLLPEEASSGFLIEKYIRTVDKTPSADEPEYVRLVRERPENLKGVCNIDDFVAWAQPFSQTISSDLNISDLFGNATVAPPPEPYAGTVGLKFGVRLSLIPNATLASQMNPASFDRDVIKREKSYLIGGNPVIPLVSYEYDYKDVKFQELKFNEPNMGEDLKCYVDKLVLTPKYKLLMNYIFGIQKVSSIASIYMNHSFIPAIGTDASERSFDDVMERFDESWKGEVLTDSKGEARRLFVGFYRSNDFESTDDEDFTLRQFLKNVMPNIFGVNRSLVPWWRRNRMRDRPFDKDGKDCAGEYGSFFTPEDD